MKDIEQGPRIRHFRKTKDDCLGDSSFSCHFFLRCRPPTLYYSTLEPYSLLLLPFILQDGQCHNVPACSCTCCHSRNTISDVSSCRRTHFKYNTVQSSIYRVLYKLRKTTMWKIHCYYPPAKRIVVTRARLLLLKSYTEYQLYFWKQKKISFQLPSYFKKTKIFL